MSAVDRYLAELRRELRGDPLFRRRVLAEVEDHLRESAAEHGEDEAVARFGSPDAVARSFAPRAASRAALAPAVAVLLAAGAFVLAYGASESALPPAPWPSADESQVAFAWTVGAAEVALAVAVIGALAAVAIRPFRLVLAAVACTAVTAAAGFAIVSAWTLFVAYERLEVAGRPGPLSFALGSVWLLAAAGTAVAALVWATAQRASRSYGFSR